MGRMRSLDGSQNAVIFDEIDESDKFRIPSNMLVVCPWGDSHGVQNDNDMVFS
jgi:hypothetical protein